MNILTNDPAINIASLVQISTLWLFYMSSTYLIPSIIIFAIYLYTASKIGRNESIEGVRAYPICNLSKTKGRKETPVELKDFGCCSKNRRLDSQLSI